MFFGQHSPHSAWIGREPALAIHMQLIGAMQPREPATRQIYVGQGYRCRVESL
jgi:hypothetical protein